MKAKLPILGLACLLLSACTSSANRYLSYKHLLMVGRGDPSAYADGYVDGCSGGRRLGGDKRFQYRQDSARFEKDALYARGWQEGQIHCRNAVLAEGLELAPSRPQAKPASLPVDTEKQAIEKEMREIWEDLRK